MVKVKVDVKVKHNIGEMKDEMNRIKREANFQQVVLEGITAIQHHQRREAPIGKSGRIPRSIKPARVMKDGSSSWSALSQTKYGPAIFTNEGTGKHAEGGSEYEITQTRTYKRGHLKGQEYTRTFNHPGIKGTGWWEIGADMGKPAALEAFYRKVDRILRRKNG